jgi:serine protease AprX
VKLVDEAKARAAGSPDKQGIVTGKTHRQYDFARLEPDVIRELVRLDQAGTTQGGEETHTGNDLPYLAGLSDRQVTIKSVSTVKADAARVSFSAYGEGIVWAVIDSGIEGSHPHFAARGNLDVTSPLRHRDFTGSGSGLRDAFGHGTHMAGIIADTLSADSATGKKVVVVARHRDENGEIEPRRLELGAISGMAPKCKLVTFDENGQGEASNLLAAIDEIQQINGCGRIFGCTG